MPDLFVDVMNSRGRSALMSAGPPPDLFYRASANQRYLTRDGVPTLMLGDSPHPLVSGLSLADIETYFALRAAKGFTCFWAEVFNTTYIAGGKTTWGTISTLPVGERDLNPFTATLAGGQWDLSARNEAYFARVDQIVALAADYGLTWFMEPFETGIGFYPGDSSSPFEANGTQRIASWGTFLGTRYKDYWNVIWQVGNDNYRGDPPNATQASLTKTMIDAIAAADPNHLITVQLNYFMSGALDNATIRPSVALGAAYSYFPGYRAAHDQWAHTSGVVRPCIAQEGFYDNATGSGAGLGTTLPPTRRKLRAQAYDFTLGGATVGYIYGSHACDDSSTNSGWSTDWQTEIENAATSGSGLADVQRWKVYLESLAWWTLQPDWGQVIVTANYGTKDGNANPSRGYDTDDYCPCAADDLTGAATLALVYCPLASAPTVNLAKFAAPIRARWWDPTAAAYTPITGDLGDGRFSASGTHDFSTPGANSAPEPSTNKSDWILELVATADVTASVSDVVHLADLAVVGHLVTITWEAVPDATDYWLEIGSTPGASDVLDVDTESTEVSYDVMLMAGTYYARVRAVVGGIIGDPSDDVEVVVP